MQREAKTPEAEDVLYNKRYTSIQTVRFGGWLRWRRGRSRVESEWGKCLGQAGLEFGMSDEGKNSFIRGGFLFKFGFERFGLFCFSSSFHYATSALLSVS